MKTIRLEVTLSDQNESIVYFNIDSSLSYEEMAKELHKEYGVSGWLAYDFDE